MEAVLSIWSASLIVWSMVLRRLPLPSAGQLTSVTILTSVATSAPNAAFISARVTGVSSTTSCSRAAATTSSRAPVCATMRATQRGGTIYGSSLYLCVCPMLAWAASANASAREMQVVCHDKGPLRIRSASGQHVACHGYTTRILSRPGMTVCGIHNVAYME